MSPLDLIPPPYNLIVKIGLPVLAIVGVWIAGDIHGHHAQGHKDEGKIAHLTEQRNGFRANQDRLTAALNVQNARVDALKADGDRRTADGRKALSDAQR